MTYIQQSGTGPGNEYLILEPSTTPNQRVSYNFLYETPQGVRMVGYLTNIVNGDWYENYKSTDMDAVFLKSSISWALRPDRKVLVEVQFYPVYFDDVGISGKYVNLRVGLCSTDLTSNGQHTRSKSELLSSTVYTMENHAVMGETSNAPSVYKAVISHSESVPKTLCFFIDSGSDTNIIVYDLNDAREAKTKIKITQLD